MTNVMPDVRSLAYRVELAIHGVLRFRFEGEPGLAIRDLMVAAEVRAAGGSLTAADLAAIRRGELTDLPEQELAVLASLCGVPAEALVNQLPPGQRLILLALAGGTRMGMSQAQEVQDRSALLNSKKSTQ